MTLESYDKARDIVAKIRNLDDAIEELRDITSNNTSTWILEVRPSKTYSTREIYHYGMLPEMLEAILSRYLAERNALMKELEKL